MKRSFDIIFSILLLLLLSPLFILIALLIRVRLGAPIFFKQLRPGKNAKLFWFYKFRTMTLACDETGILLKDEARMTKLGLWLRKTSIDELPQLWNVLRGNLSFVGPRPLLPEYLPLYSPEQSKRHLVKPGITGWAQINGRNAIKWEDKLRLDVWYVDHHSFWLDLKILWLTFIKVLTCRDITQNGHVTTEKFKGDLT